MLTAIEQLGTYPVQDTGAEIIEANLTPRDVPNLSDDNIGTRVV